MSRLADLVRFYNLMDELEQKLGGAKKLYDCKQEIDWPVWGIYFFLEEGELRSETKLAASRSNAKTNNHRITSVRRHNIGRGSNDTLWSRLQGNYSEESETSLGNHRKAVLRKHVGAALIRRNQLTCPTWGEEKINESDAERIRRAEQPMELYVDIFLGEVEVLWLAVNDIDVPSNHNPETFCDKIKQHSIALLSNFAKPPLDAPSPEWLGNFNPNYDLRTSGLWNQLHVDESYTPNLLDTLEDLIAKM